MGSGDMPTFRSSDALNGHSDPNFQNFFERWIVEQRENREVLASALTVFRTRSSGIGMADQVFSPLIRHVLEHYEKDYQIKYKYAKKDNLAMLSPSWTSKLEDGISWIGEWRANHGFSPTLIKVRYGNIFGMQFEENLMQLLEGLPTGDSIDLSGSQLHWADELQQITVREEMMMDKEMAKQQVIPADTSSGDLTNLVTLLMRNAESSDGAEEEEVKSVLECKTKGFIEIVRRADDLRLRTLKSVIEILTPIQAAHVLIAAADLHLRVHEWGVKEDADSSS